MSHPQTSISIYNLVSSFILTSPLSFCPLKTSPLGFPYAHSLTRSKFKLIASPPQTCFSVQFSSVQLLSHVWLFATPWTTARQASLSITNSRSLLKLVPIESVMPSSHYLILCRPLLLPPIPSSIRVFSNELVLRIRWPKYWSFSFSISPSNEHPGLSSFMMDWLDLLAVQGTLKSLLQHQSSKASVLQCSAFFIVQLSHSYMTTGKTIALTRRTFVGKVMSLPSNMLSSLVITFLPRSKCLFISWLQSPSAVSLEPPKIKSDTVSTVSPSISHEVMGPDAMILVFWMLSFKPTFSLSSFTFIKRFFSSSSLSAIRVVSSAYLRLLIFLPAILIPACASSSPAFLMMSSAYKLNKQGDNIQSWCSPFPASQVPLNLEKAPPFTWLLGPPSTFNCQVSRIHLSSVSENHSLFSSATVTTLIQVTITLRPDYSSSLLPGWSYPGSARAYFISLSPQRPA